VLNNIINDNSNVGVCAFGACTWTSIRDNTIQNNGASGTNNVDISEATGIIYRP
jgi:hypothetical protein